MVGNKIATLQLIKYQYYKSNMFTLDGILPLACLFVISLVKREDNNFHSTS